ncbi:MAG: lipoyl(octanoyl) transferase LipB [Gammaproteobacteria bacterium]|nr:lipoyl(octanoyl) transferase LipB [Gammaproteobacteria bacterium]
MTNHSKPSLILRHLGLQEYDFCWQAMKHFTDKRNEHTPDEIWFLEHPPVFTQGQNGKPEHILNTGDIPVVQTDRGGQVTYHGPGQLVVYTLIDLRRRKLNVREMVSLLENAVIQCLAQYNISAIAKCKAPGVYINDKKIASVGLRIRRGCSYHGLAFNIAMKTEPFTRINPCGFEALEITQLQEHVPEVTVETVLPLLEKVLESLLK